MKKCDLETKYLSGKEQNLPALGLQEDSGDNYNYCDNHYQKEITIPPLMFPCGSEALNTKGGGTKTTHYVVIRKIPMFFQSCFHCLAWCIFLQYYRTF